VLRGRPVTLRERRSLALAVRKIRPNDFDMLRDVGAVHEPVRRHGLGSRKAAGLHRPGLVVHVLIRPDLTGARVDLNLLAVKTTAAEGHCALFHIEHMFDNHGSHL